MDPEGDLYQYLYQEIRTYTDRPTRRTLVDPRDGLKPFGYPVNILFPGADARQEPSMLFTDVNGAIKVSGDESVLEVAGVQMVPFGPFEQVTITPTVRGKRRTTSITYRHLGDLFIDPK